jgi:hypothetical protein
MKNYKALKSASKASVAKVKIIDQAKVDEVKYKDGDDIPDGKEVGDVKVQAQAEESHEELQLTLKSYDSTTGEELDDEVQSYGLTQVAWHIEDCKSIVAGKQAEQSDWEELEKDLKAL